MNLYLLTCAGHLFTKLATSRKAARAWGRAHFGSRIVFVHQER